MSDLETALRSAARSGRLNHLSLAVKWSGGWEAAYRGVANEDHRMVAHSDPVAALIGALTGRKVPEPEKPVRKRNVVVKAVVPDDNEDIL